MKVYNQNSNKTKSKRASSTLWYIVLLVAVAALIALAIALASVNAGKASLVSGNGDKKDVEPVTTDPIEYVLPFSQYTVAREASLDKLVYMPSVNMWKTHNGVDFLPGNDDNVAVMADGTVKSVEQSTLEGWIVAVEHGDGLVSYYKSLASASVKAGDSVKAGAAIGVAGEMISESDLGKHVHVEVTLNGKLVDPLDYLDTDTTK